MTDKEFDKVKEFLSMQCQKAKQAEMEEEEDVERKSYLQGRHLTFLEVKNFIKSIRRK